VLTIELGKGFVTTIDEADWDLVKPYHWTAIWNGNHWYAVTKEKDVLTGKTHYHYMHRLIMGDPVGKLVDHIDDDGLMNTRENLRIATRQQNNENTKPHRDTITGFKGVWVIKKGGKLRYGARLTYAGHRINLGVYSTPEEAARAYDTKASELFGEFVKTNFEVQDDTQ
jgi:hypothetical protein